MNRAKIILITVVAIAAIAVSLGLKSRNAAADDSASEDKWEYLIVAGGTTNFVSPRELSLRKEPGAFSRESYPIEQNLDKLGAKGWELIAVLGNPADPTYYFKRRK